MSLFVTIVWILCQVLFWAIVARAVLSWFSIRPDNPLLIILNEVTEPILSPLRRVVPRIGMFDITPIVAIFILWLIPLLLHAFF